nr:hypothetical protein [uncultured Desulfobacter sp.]
MKELSKLLSSFNLRCGLSFSADMSGQPMAVLYETPPSKKGIVSRWFMAFCPTTLSLPLQVEGIKSIKLLSLLGKN